MSVGAFFFDMGILLHFAMPVVLQFVWGCLGPFCICEKFRGIGKEEKKKSSLSHPEVPMEIPEEPVTVNEKLQQGYIDWCYVMKDSVNGTCEGCGENILGYQTLSINVSVGKKMRK